MPKTQFVDFKAVKAAITMEQVLGHYGLMDKFKRGTDSLNGPCPIHKGSNPTQFRVSISKNIWNCFSECKHGGNVLDFISEIQEELKAFFGTQKRVERLMNETSHNLAEKTGLLDTHRHEIQKVREEMRQTHQLYLKEQISGDGFRDLYGPAEARFKQLQAELPKLEAEVDFLKVNKLSADDIVRESAKLHERWPSMPLDDKRRIVEALIEKIVIGEGEIDITYSCAPSSEEQCKSQQGLRMG